MKQFQTLNRKVAAALFALFGVLSVFYIVAAVQSTQLYQQEILQKLNRTLAGHIAKDIPLQNVALGNPTGKLVLVGWGSTYGAIHQAVKRCRAEGLDVSHVHVRYISPLPSNLGEILCGFEQVLVPEMNTGQLINLLRAKYLVDAEGLNKVSGQPFKIGEIIAAIHKEFADMADVANLESAP